MVDLIDYVEHFVRSNDLSHTHEKVLCKDECLLDSTLNTHDKLLTTWY